ncbi:MAG TPA: hypothetical protein VEU53_01810 [Stellaceae bacterium]|nr:hypothetical protein [Stellaceae bacterium]
MLDSWHDFYVILATAAGTLIGAMFIVASIGGRNMTRARAAAIASFVTPTVIHLSVVLLACALLVVPTLDRQTLGIIGVIGGLIGLAAAAHICWQVLHSKVDHVDRLWYGGLPLLGYVGIVVAAVMIVAQNRFSLETLAAAFGLLIVASIRNAWDLIIFLVGQDRNAP